MPDNLALSAFWCFLMRSPWQRFLSSVVRVKAGRERLTAIIIDHDRRLEEADEFHGSRSSLGLPGPPLTSSLRQVPWLSAVTSLTFRQGGSLVEEEVPGAIQGEAACRLADCLRLCSNMSCSVAPVQQIRILPGWSEPVDRSHKCLLQHTPPSCMK